MHSGCSADGWTSPVLKHSQSPCARSQTAGKAHLQILGGMDLGTDDGLLKAMWRQKQGRTDQWTWILQKARRTKDRRKDGRKGVDCRMSAAGRTAENGADAGLWNEVHRKGKGADGQAGASATCRSPEVKTGSRESTSCGKPQRIGERGKPGTGEGGRDGPWTERGVQPAAGDPTGSTPRCRPAIRTQIFACAPDSLSCNVLRE